MITENVLFIIDFDFLGRRQLNPVRAHLIHRLLAT